MIKEFYEVVGCKIIAETSKENANAQALLASSKQTMDSVVVYQALKSTYWSERSQKSFGTRTTQIQYPRG